VTTDPVTTLPSGQRVLHRLTLALEVLDSLSSRPVAAPVLVQRDASRRQFRGIAGNGGRFVLLYGSRAGGRAELRITDPSRQYVPRRLSIPLWSRGELEAADRVPPGPYIPARSRLLRVWMSPGPAYLPGRGFTMIRGQVIRGGTPVRWPMLDAQGPGGLVVGRARGDERGEFLLLVTGMGNMPPPAPSTISVDLLVFGPGPGGPAPPTAEQLAADPLADLPVEMIPRSSAPPLDTDLDNPLLRGEELPPFYVPSTVPGPTVDVEVGDLTPLAAPVQFSP
jgi:hypothetical protein